MSSMVIAIFTIFSLFGTWIAPAGSSHIMIRSTMAVVCAFVLGGMVQ
jgi:hypothetical protein